VILRRLRLCLAAVALTSLLGGCVAIAIPVLAGGAIARQQAKSRSGDQAKPPQAVQPSHRQPGRQRAEITHGEETAVQLTNLTQLPPPSAADAAHTNVNPGNLPDFARFALEKAQPPPAGENRTSVILAEGSTLTSPKLDSCADLAPAVVIDLDPANADFDPALPGQPAAGLPQSLAAMRSAGLTILWASSLPVDQAQPVYARLRATGLDPDGTDRLLLQRKPNERKQTRLRAAAKAYCVIAMAGDKRGDFDELYDYLRDPGYAVVMDRMFGAGWFLGPPPLQ
jgi:hypothetical protein